MTGTQQVLTLSEYHPAILEMNQVSIEDGECLYHQYGKKIQVEFPSPVNDQQWRFTSQGWVGYLAVSPSLALHLQPKVTMRNLFGMLEVAYRLKDFEFLQGLYDCDTLQEVYDSLARVLANKVLERCQKGLYAEYRQQRQRSMTIKGRLDMAQTVKAPWKASLPNVYEEHTRDLDENRILLWTLHRILRSNACNAGTRTLVRTSCRELGQTVSLTPFTTSDCVDRVYNRLNHDYLAPHTLCRFFLESCGPRHDPGQKQCLPFLINMASLFELYVAEWLKEHAPQEIEFEPHHKIYLSNEPPTLFDLDVLVKDRETGQPLVVLDTKYKVPNQPSTGDIQQVVAYAEAVGCKQAFLVYPRPLTMPFHARIGDIQVGTLTFDIRNDLTFGGEKFMRLLIQACLQNL